VGLSRLKSLENQMGDNIKLIALDKQPNSSLQSRPARFQDFERDMDATLLVYFASDPLYP
jgi:hypothetical protein